MLFTKLLKGANQEKGNAGESVLTAWVCVWFLGSLAGRRNIEVQCPRAISLCESQGENEGLLGLE